MGARGASPGHWRAQAPTNSNSEDKTEELVGSNSLIGEEEEEVAPESGDQGEEAGEVSGSGAGEMWGSRGDNGGAATQTWNV